MRRRERTGSTLRTSLRSSMRRPLRIEQAVDEPQQGGFAGAGCADDPQEFRRGNIELDIVDGHDAFGVMTVGKALPDMGASGQGASAMVGLDHCASVANPKLALFCGKHLRDSTRI